MNKRKLIIISMVVVLGLSLAIYQYAKEMQAELASAQYSVSKPANGHSWTEMECTAGMCVTADNKVGMGTFSPSQKLEVVGDGLFTGDVCNGTGACLSDIEDFISGQPLVNNAHNYAACTAAGGTVVPSDVSYPQCRFDAAVCPSAGSWSPYKNYTTTTAGTASCNCYNACTSTWWNEGNGSWDCNYTWTCTSCPRGGHVWGNIVVETTGACCTPTVSSPITQIGCF